MSRQSGGVPRNRVAARWRWSARAGLCCSLLAAPAAGTRARAAAPPPDRNAYIAQAGHPNVFKEFAGQPCVYLLREVCLRLHDGTTEVATHDVIAITSPAGRQWATRQLLLGDDVKLAKVNCATLALNNVRMPMRDQDLHRKQLEGYTEYTFLLPGAGDGSILDFSYEQKLDWMLLFFEFLASWDAAPVLHARFIVESDAGIDPSVFLDRCPPGLHTERNAEGTPGAEDARVVYDIYDVIPARGEALAPPFGASVPRAAMYLAGRRNWNHMAVGWEPYLRQVCDLSKDGEAKKLVQSLTAGLSADVDKCAAILTFTRGQVRLVDAGQSFGLQPRAATKTLESRAGSEADVTALAIGMLRQAGIPVQIALVREATAGDWFGNVYMAQQFSRLMTAVGVLDQWYWLDPTCRDCTYGDLNWRLRGQQCLLFEADIEQDVDEALKGMKISSLRDWDSAVADRIQNAHWVNIVDLGSAPDWEDPPQVCRTRLEIDPAGALRGTLDVGLLGDPKLETRAALRAASAEGQQAWCLARLREQLPGAELTAHSIAGLEPNLAVAADQDSLHIHLEFALPDFIPPQGQAFVKASFFTQALRDPIGSGKRVQPIWGAVAAGELDHVTLRLPPGFDLVPHPANQDLTGEWLQYKTRWRWAGSEVQFSRLWATRRGTLPPEKAPTVHAEYGKAVQLEGQVIKLGMTGTSVAP